MQMETKQQAQLFYVIQNGEASLSTVRRVLELTKVNLRGCNNYIYILNIRISREMKAKLITDLKRKKSQQ